MGSHRRTGVRTFFIIQLFYLDFFYAKLKEKKVGKEKEKYFRYILWLNSYVISRHHSDLNDVGEYLEKFKEKGEVEGLFEYFKKIIRIIIKDCSSLMRKLLLQKP